MSQNGDDAEVRDAMINPVQRRESSAARFLKHFRPDRNNPAYHSVGKGLRKRRNWASERQLTTNTDNSNPVVASSANDPPPAGAAADPRRYVPWAPNEPGLGVIRLGADERDLNGGAVGNGVAALVTDLGIEQCRAEWGVG